MCLEMGQNKRTLVYLRAKATNPCYISDVPVSFWTVLSLKILASASKQGLKWMHLQQEIQREMQPETGTVGRVQASLHQLIYSQAVL